LRAAAFFTLAAGMLIAAPVSAAANTVAFDFTIGLTGSGGVISLLSPSALTFHSSAFSLFDPALGTLNGVSETISGSLTWTTGRKFELSGGQSGAFGANLQLSDDTAVQTFRSFTSSPQIIDIDVSGTDSNAGDLLAFIGKGTTTTYVALLGSGTTGQTLSAATLEGTLTYDYTPPPAGIPTSAAVPEPSTWAMMVVGFAGLGYAALRRKRSRAHLA
jgi:PEP-CTERM motif